MAILMKSLAAFDTIKYKIFELLLSLMKLIRLLKFHKDDILISDLVSFVAPCKFLVAWNCSFRKSLAKSISYATRAFL